MKVIISKGQIQIESSLGNLIGQNTLLLSHIATLLVSAGTNRTEVVKENERTITFDYEVEERLKKLEQLSNQIKNSIKQLDM